MLSTFHLLSFGEVAWLTSFSYPSKKLVLITSLQCSKASRTTILSMKKTADFSTRRICKHITASQTPYHYHFQELCMASWNGFSDGISMALHAPLLSYNDLISCMMILRVTDGMNTKSLVLSHFLHIHIEIQIIHE